MKPKTHVLLLSILFLIVGIIIGVIASKYLPVLRPLTPEAVCHKGGYQDVRSCGGYFIAGKPCCDQGADIWNEKNQIVVRCGGWGSPPGTPESECEKLLKNLDTKNCQELACSLEDAKKIRPPYSLWEKTILFIRRFLSGNDASRAISTAVKVTPTPPSTDPTANWKTYVNSTYGYTISYPPNFNVTLCKECRPPEMTLILNNQDKSISVGIESAHQFSLCANNPSPCIPVNNLSVVIQGKQYQLEEYFIDYYKKYLYKIGDILKNGASSQISISGEYSSLENANTLSQILSTFKFLEAPATNYPVSTYTRLTYLLPPGWQTVKDSTNTLEIGFDPNNTKSQEVADGIYLLKLRPDINLGYSGFFSLSIHSYDGGSRHKFIYQYLNNGQPPTRQDIMKDYFEKEYVYDGKSCLFLHNIQVSQMPTIWGMCDAGNGKGLVIGTYSSDYEPTFRTIRVLNQ